MRTLLATCLMLFLATGILGCFLAGEKVPPGILPEHTVLYDANDDGILESLAHDADDDGQADVVDGQVQVIPGSKKLVAAIAADTKGPKYLAAAGAVAGVPLLGAVAALWRKQKWAQGAVEIVETVQAARKKLSEADGEGLKLLDAELQGQSRPTQNLVAAVKQKQKIASVTHYN